MNYNNKWVIEKYQAKEKLKFLFFWGHQPNKDGSITQSCFSQWWYSPFEIKNITYKTAEHWMMCEKARLFNDEASIHKIQQAKTPAEAKKLGRLIKNFNTIIWDERKYQIVVEGNFHKFSQHEDLNFFLQNTKNKILVEASPVDPVWGIGMAADNPHIENPLLWKGENLLGFALMEVRDRLKYK